MNTPLSFAARFYPNVWQFHELGWNDAESELGWEIGPRLEMWYLSSVFYLSFRELCEIL